jgi:hypothetical protein
MGLLDWLKGRGKGGGGGGGHPPGKLGMTELARRLEMSEQALRALKVEYASFTIPKRDGRRRTILAPSPALKQAQRRILRRLLGRPRAHPAVTGFERGHSIVTAARHHAGQAVVVRMDIRDFFTSTRAERVRDLFRKLDWDAEASELLTRLCTHSGGLPQGAPTSPRLSSLVNWGLDATLQGFCDKLGARYTRYADDLTFSLDTADPTRAHKLLYSVPAIAEASGYEVHKRRKLHIRRRHERQEVCGLVVNERPELSRRKRRWLRAVRHRVATGGKATLTPAQLAGWEALEHMIRTQREEAPDGGEARG